MFGDAAEHVAEVGFWVEVVQLGGFDEAVEGGGAFGATVRTGEQLILAADGHRAVILPVSGRK